MFRKFFTLKSRKLKYANRLVFWAFLVVFVYCFIKLRFNDNENETLDRNDLFRPHCDCLKEEIQIVRSTHDVFIVNRYRLSGESRQVVRSYELTYDDLAPESTFTCDIYNEFKRGKHQKVVSYSLYGNDSKYYDNLGDLARLVKKFYPDFVVRIHYDNTVNKSVRCWLECNFDNVDFCYMNELKLGYSNHLKMNLSYMHKMVWRFLPIGDTFVSLFMSRDTDSLIIQREKDSVSEWIKSKNIGHIMRDHNGHGREIMGGMWGFKNEVNRTLSKYLFKVMLNQNVSKRYSWSGTTRKGFDQFFLTDIVYPKLVNISTIHDSFYCKKYPNSQPFPTKRNGSSYIGARSFQEMKVRKCAVECRPVDHKDWLYC